jgi:predicted heme/steroid binding protein
MPGCGNEWEVPLQVRALSVRGCQECGWRKTGAHHSRPRLGESLAEVSPTLAAELIEVIDHPGWTVNDLLPYSNKQCRWRCSKPGCGYKWSAPPSRRSGEGSGCSECGHKRTPAARARPKLGQSLLDHYPMIGAELVEVIRHPGWTASDLRVSSTKPCTWQCSKSGCSSTWEATPDQRTRRGGTGKRFPECHPPRKPRSSSRP